MNLKVTKHGACKTFIKFGQCSERFLGHNFTNKDTHFFSNEFTVYLFTNKLRTKLIIINLQHLLNIHDQSYLCNNAYKMR